MSDCTCQDAFVHQERHERDTPNASSSADRLVTLKKHRRPAGHRPKQEEPIRHGDSRATDAFWGTGDVLGGDYLLLDGVPHRFSARRKEENGSRHYDLKLDDDGRQMKYVAVSRSQ